MAETRYIISDAAKIIDVEPHVLRYWEEELKIEIPRNELGHRYYTDREIKLFEHIRDLKEKGFQLKAIALILSTLDAEISMETSDLTENHMMLEPELKKSPPIIKVHEDLQPANEMTPGEKLQHFRTLMEEILMDVMEEEREELSMILTEKIEIILSEKMKMLEKNSQEQSEHYYRLLDEAIRGRQKLHQEVAAARVPSYGIAEMPKKKKRLFRKKFRY